MKKIIAVILVLFVMSAVSACNSDGSADIWIFADSFNSQSDDYRIDLSGVTASASGGTKEYECFIDVGNGKNILLTLNAEKDGTVSSLSVTAAAEDKIPVAVFCAVSETAADVLTQETDEDVSAALDALGMSPPENTGKKAAAYYETLLCRYSLVSNSEGTAFIAELIKYLENTSEPLSLRTDSESSYTPETSDSSANETATSFINPGE